MNPDIKARWVAALRSGEYRQGSGVLEQTFAVSAEEGDIVRHCCLGVLCVLAVKDGVASRERDPLRGVTTRFISGDSSSDGFLPGGVMRWAGLDNVSPHVPHESRGDVSLAGLNDDNVTFAEIANLIEEHL